MKRLLIPLILVLTALFASAAPAAERSVTVLLVGGPGNDLLDINLSQDGRNYLINSFSPLEAGGGICVQPEESHHELICEAPAIAGFEVNAGAGDDAVVTSPKVLVPTTLRGGPGRDRLRAGSGADKVIGGAGDDSLLGSGGDDWLLGGPGKDMLFGGPGDDRLTGGPDADYLNGGHGVDDDDRGPLDQVGSLSRSP